MQITRCIAQLLWGYLMAPPGRASNNGTKPKAVSNMTTQRGRNIVNILTYFCGCLKYFWDFWSNIKVFGQNNVIFEFLQQKTCRIIYKFRQKPNFEPETCEI